MTKRLVIAEKPSVGMSIAAVLGVTQVKISREEKKLIQFLREKMC